MKLEFKNCEYSFITLPLSDVDFAKYSNWLEKNQKTYSLKRKQEFLAGRICAKESLLKLGISVECLKKNNDGSPQYPIGVCGSITHNKHFAISIVSNHYQSIGIDIEEVIKKERLDRLKKSFVFENEFDFLNENAELNGTLIFSAKESLYKLIRPLCGTYFGFEQARVRALGSTEFEIELLGNDQSLLPYARVYKGAWILYKNNIVTWILL